MTYRIEPNADQLPTFGHSCHQKYQWQAYVHRLASIWITSILLAVAVTVSTTDLGFGQTLPLPDGLKAQQQRQVELIQQIIQPTVCIHSPDGGGGGSGVLISADGYALTNYHVVQPCGSYMQCTLSDGRLYDAVIVGIDPTGDVALIQLLGREDFPVATWGDSDLVQPGQTCFAVGNPFLLATNRQPTVTRGIISGTHRYQEPAGTLLEYTDCIQIDAAVNPGNSGGPLFNHRGELVGINGRCSFEKRGRINVGVAYAISINQIKMFLPALKSGRVVDHATLGASFRSQEQKVVVDRLLDDSDAADLGLEPGDQLLEFGGQSISSVNQFKNELGIYPNHWHVSLKFLHQGQTIQGTVRLRALHNMEELQPTTLPFRPSVPGPQQRPDPAADPSDVQQATGPSIPDAVQQRLEYRPGFVNYFYNRKEQSRVFQNLKQRRGSSDDANEGWSLKGTDRDRGELRIEISADRAGFLSDLETRTSAWPDSLSTSDTERVVKLEASDQLSDRHLFLQGLMAWNRLTYSGPDDFPLTIYMGKYPSRWEEEPMDVILVSYSDLEVQFYIDQEGTLRQWICTQMGQSAGCEVRLDEWKTTPLGRMPGRIQAWSRGETFLDYEVESFAARKVSP